MMLIFQAVLAAEPATYALRAEVPDLPATGPAIVELGPDLVGGAPADLSSTLLVTDAAGTPVPYAVMRSDPTAYPERDSLNVVPLDLETWQVGRAEAPVDELAFDVEDLATVGPLEASVTWSNGRSVGLLYQLDDATLASLSVAHATGPFRVTLRSLRGAAVRLENVSGLRYGADHVPSRVETLPVGPPTLTEDGRARYVLHLDGPREVRSISLQVGDAEDAFERQVSVTGPDQYTREGTVRRLRIGDADVDRVKVSFDSEPIATDTLTVLVQTDRGRPLPVESIRVDSTDAWLLVRDAGAGPHAIYGGATQPDASYDLSYAAPELIRQDPPHRSAGAATANPTYVPLPTRTGVDAPGPDLRLSRFHFERPILADPGWARITLDQSVLARTRSDLGDVRVVDAQGRQIPFLLRDTGEEVPWETAAFERKEDGSVTQIRVPLDSNAPVATVSIVTGHDVFERTVTVLRDAGRRTVPLRVVNWRGTDQGSTLTIGVNAAVGNALLVRFENGDNPPLPIESVSVTAPRWEVRARIPDGGARLVYGAPGEEAPSYDLSLLTDEVRRLPMAEAKLGAEADLTPPAVGALDRVMTVAGVGLLVVGLLGMAVRVLRGVAEPVAGVPGPK